MDFSNLDTQAGSDAGFELRLRHPSTNKILDASITVHGKDSKRYEAEFIARNRRWAILARDLAGDELPDDEAIKGSIDLLAAATSGWKNVELDGVPLEFNEKNVREFYTRFKWVREQVDKAIHDRANFIVAFSTD